MRAKRFAVALAAGAAATMLVTPAALADVSPTDPSFAPQPGDSAAPAPVDSNVPEPSDSDAPNPGDSQAPNPGDSEAPNPGDSQAPNPGDSEAPVEPPKDFKFTEDKVDFGWVDATPENPPGIKLNVTCPSTVAASSNWFASSPEFTKAGDMLWSGTGYLDYEKILKEPNYLWIRVSCAGYGYLLFEDKAPSEEPGKPGKPKPPKLTPAKPKVPVGAPQTGDGTTLREAGMPLAASGSAVALLAMAGITLAARRRVSGQESE